MYLCIQIFSFYTKLQNSVNCEASIVLNMAESCVTSLHYFILFSPLPIKQANTVITIFGFTSTRSSGRAYIRAPIFRATEMAYLEKQEKINIVIFLASTGMPRFTTRLTDFNSRMCPFRHYLHSMRKWTLL